MNGMSRTKPCKISLAVQYASKSRLVPSRAQLRRWICAALKREAVLTIRIVDEPEGRKLNREYRDKDYATNVLTFAYDDCMKKPLSGHSQVLCGDAVICAPVVEREAAAQHKELIAHYAHLTIHAALHLQGFDHMDENNAAAMESLETELMLKLRYPDPYRVARH